jgi:hypothetical protein
LLNAVEVLGGIQGSLLGAPGEDFCACDLTLACSEDWAQVDVTETQLDDVHVAVFEETELLTK